MSNLAAGQFRMLMAGLHAHESSQVSVEKIEWKNAHTSEAFKINILLRRWQECLDCGPKSSDFIHAILSLSQLRSVNELEHFQPLHVSVSPPPPPPPLVVVVVGNIYLSLSLSPAPSLPPFLSSCLSFPSLSLCFFGL